MRRNGTSLVQKQRWMREKHSATSLPDPACASFAERHYSVAEIASMWNLSQDAVRKMFQREPGVMVLGDHGSRHRRRYTTLRIPASVVERVHRRLANV